MIIVMVEGRWQLGEPDALWELPASILFAIFEKEQPRKWAEGLASIIKSMEANENGS